MKSNLHRSITVFMAFLVLMSSTGFAFIEHECLVRGKSVQVVTDLKKDSSEEKAGSSCCAKSKKLKEAKGTFFKKTDCCKESQTFEKLQVTTSSGHELAKLLKSWNADHLFFIPRGFLPLIEQEIGANAPPAPEISFSSRLHGKIMRYAIQSLLI
ncbi:hypothetical protein L0663_26415 [Dyadobacter sp. CY107]|uniref:hypothetical protein n=1 Tax=Dyadobacter fanqingshengii TaxID=2906443 RepID=UPI001F378FB1|nr:hypothetical protein [Dyadobacter fanqingshengii]MCF2506953.1 hypothetical protein [Dyadobacter fanqingshengii]